MFEDLISKNKFLKNPKIQSVNNIDIKGVVLSNNNENNLEIVLCSAITKPNTSNLRSIWKNRKGGTASPLLVICNYLESVSICGPLGDEPTVYEEINTNIAKKICEESICKTDDALALRSLKDLLSTLNQNNSGIKNEGLFANHILENLHINRSDWSVYSEKAKKIVGKKNNDLLSSLGYEYFENDNLTYFLKAEGKKRALGVLLKPDEIVDIQNKRFGNISPITYAFNVADNENLPFVIICSESSIRLYPTNINLGVGRKGRTETYIHCETNILSNNDLGKLIYIFSADAIKKNGLFYELIDESKRFANDLAQRLREGIYLNVIPLLAKGILENYSKKEKNVHILEEVYSLSMLLLFRLLFIAYAEDKDLLPYKTNDLYKKRSLKSICLEIKSIIENKDDKKISNNTFYYWDSIKHIFNAINSGNKSWGVPIYNGGLFSHDKNLSPLSSRLDSLKISDQYLFSSLSFLFLSENDGIIGPNDFRSLGVREFGTIYEGLLESELGFNSDEENKEFDNSKIYLRNKSGERKSTGTFYTKSFVVDYLLEESLNNVILEHLNKISKMNDEDAGDNFFDFKIADIAMGSGHFLVAAIDFIEIKFSNYLSSRKIPKINKDIEELRIAAKNNLKEFSTQIEIEDSQILRRIIARRCIYGVDENQLAVDLARLSIWIHTFVPGLPLSFLDHNLVCGNSLIGIGNLDEIRDKFIQDEEQINMPLLFSDPTDLLLKAINPLKKLSNLSDTTINDIKKAELASKEAKEAIKPINALCDIVTASRIKKDQIEVEIDRLNKDLDTLFGSKLYNKYLDIINLIQPFHFPIAFPEVFLREKKGFDLIVGNPPWEEAIVEEDSFWSIYFPGLHSMKVQEKKNEILKLKEQHADIEKIFLEKKEKNKLIRLALLSGSFAGMGTGDPDLYKGFCWRFISLTGNNGHISVVLPRTVFNSLGSTEFRKKLLDVSDEIKLLFLLNKNQWVFDDIHPQFTISLLNLRKNNNEKKKSELKITKIITNKEEFNNLSKKDFKKFNFNEIQDWNPILSIPVVQTTNSLDVFQKMSSFPNLSNKENSWNLKFYSELHATNDKKLINTSNNFNIKLHRELDATNDKKLINTKDNLNKNNKYWPVYKGNSFNLWEPDTGIYYGFAKADIMTNFLYKRRLNSYKNIKSPFNQFDEKEIKDKNTLPCLNYRIAFRNVSRRTDTRTFICSIIPKKTFLANHAPYIIFQNENYEDLLYLLGILSSIPFDWYSRIWIEINLNFFIVENLPVPRLDKESLIYKQIVETALDLVCQSDHFIDLGLKFKKKIKRLEDKKINELLSKIDALALHAYNLSLAEVDTIYKTFHPTWDYNERLNMVKKFYKEII